MSFLKDTYIRVVIVVTLAALAVLHFYPQLENREHISEAKAFSNAVISLGQFKVEKVIDGDTIKLNDGRLVRLIGVDTPELHHSELPVQRFSREAADFVFLLLNGKTVKLECELGNLKDKYGRTLAYVYVDEVLVNLELVKKGYGYAYTRFPFSKMPEFIEAEKSARECQYGLWNYSLRDGRLAEIAASYESLNQDGKRKFDEMLLTLKRKYPAGD